jgi:hypothetical protein
LSGSSASPKRRSCEAFNDLTGKKFGALCVIAYVGTDRHGRRKWRVQCEQCGPRDLKTAGDRFRVDYSLWRFSHLPAARCQLATVAHRYPWNPRILKFVRFLGRIPRI